MTEHAAVAHVAAGDFKIGGADAGLAHAQQRVAARLNRLAMTRLKRQRLIEYQSAHDDNLAALSEGFAGAAQVCGPRSLIVLQIAAGDQMERLAGLPGD